MISNQNLFDDEVRTSGAELRGGRERRGGEGEEQRRGESDVRI